MRRLLIWMSPLVGVVLGMIGIMVFRQQMSAEATIPVHRVRLISPAAESGGPALEAGVPETVKTVRK